jgi:hypothetical protein
MVSIGISLTDCHYTHAIKNYIFHTKSADSFSVVEFNYKENDLGELLKIFYYKAIYM